MSFLCNDCPRRCNIDRDVKKGFCSCSNIPHLVRAAPHFGEEPCISGKNGSGTLFFSGCNLKCSFCQNHEISRNETGRAVSYSDISDIMLNLQDSGVHNINLVTAAHYVREVAKALENARLSIPVVWNSSGYESVESLRMLEGLVDIYLPDYKYCDSKLALKLSFARDYPEIASSAIKEMYRQVGPFKINNDGIMEKGVIIRHLIIPGYIENSMDVIDYVADSFSSSDVLFSLMSQFTPMDGCDIKDTVSKQDNDSLIHYMKIRGLDGFVQDVSSSTDELIPKFDLTGV